MQDALIAAGVQGDDSSEGVENLLLIPCADKEAAIGLFRELMNNEVAKAHIDRMGIKGTIVKIRSKIGSLAKLTEIVKILEEARKRAT